MERWEQDLSFYRACAATESARHVLRGIPSEREAEFFPGRSLKPRIMALFPNRMDTGNRMELPMFRMQRHGIPQLSDLFSELAFRTLRGLPQHQFLRDMKDSRYFPDYFDMRYEGFRVKIKLSVGNFKPGEVKVEIADMFLVIEAKHEERKEKQCFVSREFKRRIYLPHLAIADKVNAKWSAYGWLSIYIPLKQPHNIPDYYSPTGRQRPIKSGDKPVKPKIVKPVPIRIEEH